MFDVFDIQVPALAASAPVEIRRAQTEFGLCDEGMAYVDGVAFGHVLRAEEAYSNLQSWMDSVDRGHWTVLTAAPAARAAAADDEFWSLFLAALVSLLQAHESWIVRCESDCDQEPLDRLTISAGRLSELLNARRTEHKSVAIVATSP